MVCRGNSRCSRRRNRALAIAGLIRPRSPNPRPMSKLSARCLPAMGFVDDQRRPMVSERSTGDGRRNRGGGGARQETKRWTSHGNHIHLGPCGPSWGSQPAGAQSTPVSRGRSTRSARSRSPSSVATVSLRRNRNADVDDDTTNVSGPKNRPRWRLVAGPNTRVKQVWPGRCRQQIQRALPWTRAQLPSGPGIAATALAPGIVCKMVKTRARHRVPTGGWFVAPEPVLHRFLQRISRIRMVRGARVWTGSTAVARFILTNIIKLLFCARHRVLERLQQFAGTRLVTRDGWQTLLHSCRFPP